MTWLAWRQFRAQAIVAAIGLAAVATVLLITHGHVASAADPNSLSGTYRQLRLLGTGLIGVPAFIGAFWGAPLVARELETGTYRLGWTQSVTRSRWLVVKLVLIAVVTVAVTAVFSTLFTWWSLPFDEFGSRIGTANFGQRGIVPIAYALFALGLGTFLGTVIRRTVPAIATTLVGFFIVRFLFQLAVRPHLLTPVRVSAPSRLFGPTEGKSATSGAWVLSTKTYDASGHVVGNHQIDRALSNTCENAVNRGQDALGQCARRIGFHNVAKIIPGDRFWTLQGWETAIFFVLACLLFMASWWWLRRRAT